MTITPYYRDEKVELYHGDARDLVPLLGLTGQVDLLLTDPPYGMQYEGRSESSKQANIRGDGCRQGVRLLRQVLREIEPTLAVDAHAYIFCHWESWPDFYDAVAPYANIKNSLIWHKDRGGVGDTTCDYARDYECILYAIRGRRPLQGKREGAVLKGFYPDPASRRHHPTQKPLALLSYLVRKSSPACGLVLDTFAGAGSTLIAARHEGRRAIGIELDERYCERAAKRLEGTAQEPRSADAERDECDMPVPCETSAPT